MPACQRARRRDRLGVELDLDDRGLAARPRALEGGRELGRLLHRLAMAAIGAGIGGEIRVLQVVPDTRPGYSRS
jgi:hypothetical protein